MFDFIAPRAIYTNQNGSGYQWFVFFQGVFNGSSANNIFAAKGPTPSSLSWITSGANARSLMSPAGSSVGIGEDFQIYDFSSYGGLGNYSVLALYNDYSSVYGGSMLAAVGGGTVPDFTYYYWYGPGGETWASGSLVKFGDLMLAGTLDAATKGAPSLVLHEGCTGNNVPGYGIGINADPYPYSGSTGYRTPIPAESYIQAGTLNSIGSSMFRPRMARNSAGFIEPSASTGSSRTWTTYVYYTPGQINTSGNCSDDYHQIWKTTIQNVGVTEVTITEN
ncbi:MAG: hypothetical protein NTZ56_06505 [Acidobacteria bacterium]|nr:hypothetical protein [Acidobacteriota bacterium]